MGFYRDGKYVYEPQDVGSGLCDQETYDNQLREKQKKLDQDHAGEIGSEIPDPEGKDNEH